MQNTTVATTSKTSASLLANLKEYAKRNNVAMHSFLSFNGKMAVYKTRDSDGTESDLKLGTTVAVNLQAITRGQAHGKKLWMGGADPRREGIVMGD